MSRLRWRHPALILIVLDIVGLAVASYLSVVELGGGVPVCGPIKGCEEVALSQYSRVAGIPVAVPGVFLSLTLLTLAVLWWRSDDPRLFTAHYVLSLIGVVFEGYFTYLQVFVIDAVCIWCATYGASLVLRFLVAFVLWWRGAAERRPAPG